MKYIHIKIVGYPPNYSHFVYNIMSINIKKFIENQGFFNFFLDCLKAFPYNKLGVFSCVFEGGV